MHLHYLLLFTLCSFTPHKLQLEVKCPKDGKFKSKKTPLDFIDSNDNLNSPNIDG